MGMGNIADTGMQAAMSNMEIISNNIANANTAGYKRSSINFADIFPSANGSSGNQIGLGVTIGSISQDFTPGGTYASGKPYDLSIGSNNGFFIMKNPSTGQISYTRGGSFQLINGYMVNFQGAHLQGYTAVNNTIPPGGSVSDIFISNASLPAKASATASINMNLCSGDAVLAGPFDPTNATTYNTSSTSTIYDSLGNTHNVVSYYVKTANNTWTANVYVDGTSVGSGALTFNPADGSLNTVTGLSNLSFTPNTGASSPQTFSISMTGTTQNVNADNVISTSCDGYQPGTFSFASIDPSGKVNIQYSNGQQLLVGQVAIANFNSTSGLSDIGNASWIATSNSGPAIVSQGNSSNNINVGVLELSNVDLTTEMINLMNAQHTFQANAQVEQTYSEVMQTVTQL